MGSFRRYAVATAAALAVAVATFAASAATEPRIALVIGNGAYPNIGALSTPPNDAKLMARTLRGLDFDVRQWLNSDQRSMKRAILDFGARLEKAGKNAVGLFFYSGHAIQVRGTNYLVPLNTMISRPADLEVEAVDVNWVLGQMSFAANRINLVVLDASRANPFARTFRSTAMGLAKMDPPPGVLIAYSTAPETVAIDGTAANSPYTGALVSAMTQPGLGLSDVFKQVAASVRAETKNRQSPWQASSLKDDLVFKAKAPPPPPPVVAQPQRPTQETIFWQSVQNSQNVDAFKAYLKQYPTGTFALLAQANVDFLERQEKQKAEEEKRRADEDRRRAELDKERLRVETERLRLMRETEVQRRAEAERLQILRNQEAQRRTELEEKLRRSEAERSRLLRKNKAAPQAAPAPPPAVSAAPPQIAARPPAPVVAAPALTLPPAPTKRVRFGSVKLIKGWGSAKQRSGRGGGLFKDYDTFTTDRLQTNKTSVMHVAFDDGAMLRMGNGTEAVVESFGPDPRTGQTAVALELRKGTLRFTAGGTAPVTATVRSRAAVMRLRSTDFAVEVTQDKTTRLVLVTGSGIVASTLGGPTVDVKPGVFVSLERDRPDVVSDPVTYDGDEPERLIVSFKADFGLSETGGDPNESEDGGDGGAEEDDDGHGDNGNGD